MFSLIIVEVGTHSSLSHRISHVNRTKLHTHTRLKTREVFFCQTKNTMDTFQKHMHAHVGCKLATKVGTTHWPKAPSVQRYGCLFGSPRTQQPQPQSYVHTHMQARTRIRTRAQCDDNYGLLLVRSCCRQAPGPII